MQGAGQVVAPRCSVVVAIGVPLFGPRGPFSAWYDVLTLPILVLPHVVLDLWRRACRAPPRRVQGITRDP